MSDSDQQHFADSADMGRFEHFSHQGNTGYFDAGQWSLRWNRLSLLRIFRVGILWLLWRAPRKWHCVWGIWVNHCSNQQNCWYCIDPHLSRGKFGNLHQRCYSWARRRADGLWETSWYRPYTLCFLFPQVFCASVQSIKLSKQLLIFGLHFDQLILWLGQYFSSLQSQMDWRPLNWCLRGEWFGGLKHKSRDQRWVDLIALPCFFALLYRPDW